MPRRRETFVAVDGTALAYRSHFAFINRPLTTRDGEVTSAVFGFVLALRRILEALEPDAIVVVFDAKGPTFRHEMYADYKATRERMPPDLRSQLPRIEDYLDASGIPRLAVPGVEADDVLASLAKRAAAEGMSSRIVSNDKDLVQVVGDGIEVVTLGKASEPPRVLGEAEVKESFGVTPAQIVDFLALTGDSSDNVPGVPGVGKKTAAKLLSQHGTLSALLEAAPGMKKGKLRENLLAGRDEVLFSQNLVTLKTDVEVDDPGSFRRRPADAEALDALFDELDFQSLREDIDTTSASDTSGYGTASDAKGLAAVVKTVRAARRGAIAAFTEDGTPRGPLAGIAICAEEGKATWIPVGDAGVPPAAAREALEPLLADGKTDLWAHDVKQLRRLLERAGFPRESFAFDTMLAAYVLDPSRSASGLADVARDTLGIEMRSLKSVIGSGKSRVLLPQAPPEDVRNLAAEAADVTFRLRERFEPELAASGLARILEDIEMPLLDVLARMEATGVRLDVPYLAELSKGMEAELARITEEAWEAAGEEFNLGSPKQVAELLFRKLGLKPRGRTKTGLSTNADVLAQLREEHPVPGLILRHREVSKLKSTYVDALPAMVDPETGRVHTSFNQAVAATGRLSSADPNLQNVPVRTPEGRQIRKAFVPSADDWRLVSCDYSQIELRIMAHMAEDEPLLAAFREDRDVHRATAALVFDVVEEDVTPEQRGQAKTINFGVMYGMGAVNLGRSLGITTREASAFIASYFERYPGVREFVESTQEKAREDLYVETLAGRRRPVPEIASGDHRTRAFGERIAVNTPIQGSAADIMKLAMIAVSDELERRGLDARMILTVHDELVFDCPEKEVDELIELARAKMEGAMELSVPLKVDAGWGRDWSEAH